LSSFEGKRLAKSPDGYEEVHALCGIDVESQGRTCGIMEAFGLRPNNAVMNLIGAWIHPARGW